MTPETYRDAILTIGSGMDRQVGGPPPQVTSQDPSPEKLDQNQKVYDSSRRRSVYLPVVRSNTYDLFTSFDFPDASATAGKRNETTVPTQSLLLMNGNFLPEASERIRRKFASRLRRSPRDIYPLLLGRTASRDEAALVREFLGESPQDHDMDLLIHTLLMSNDFLFVR